MSTNIPPEKSSTFALFIDLSVGLLKAKKDTVLLHSALDRNLFWWHLMSVTEDLSIIKSIGLSPE